MLNIAHLHVTPNSFLHFFARALSFHRRNLLILFIALGILWLPNYGVVLAANPVPVQIFYVPVPEDQVFDVLTTIFPGTATCGSAPSNVIDPINTYISISSIADNTIIYYDHWEDGFEANIEMPLQASTEIWGDGNLTNGVAPGVTGDIINADTVIVLDNPVNTGTLQSVLDFDGGDKLAASKTIGMTRAAWSDGPKTLLAGAVEIYDTNLWGTRYEAPVGEDVAAFDSFQSVSLAVMAAEPNTVVTIDKDNNGTFETTVTLNEGESHLVNGGVLAGAVVSTSAPVQTTLLTGDICDTYESRWFTLFPSAPITQAQNSYYTPVSTQSTDATTVFLYNPNPTAITVDWQTQSGPQSSITVNGGAVGSQVIPVGSAAHFQTTDGRPFTGIAIIDSNGPDSDFNGKADWGFTLVPQDALTPQVMIGWGPGRDPLSSVNPTENASPVWVTPVIPGNVAGSVNICVDYDGNGAGPLTDPSGLGYDQLLTLSSLANAAVYDTDGDQTGMIVYICDATAPAGTKLAAAWGQDPSAATPGEPGLDAGTVIPPLSSFDAGKASELINDLDSDGEVDPGDTLLYTVVIRNNSRVPIPDVIISDTLSIYTTYVPSTTTFDNGNTTVAIPDDSSGTPFPLDNGGVTLGTLPFAGVFTVTLQATVNLTIPDDIERVVNQAVVRALDEEDRPKVDDPIDRDPSLTIEKSTNGEDADTPTGPAILVGEAVTWTYVVDNTSAVTITNMQVTDNIAGITPIYVSGDTSNDNILDPDETWIFQATGIATGTLLSSQYANIGSVTGQGPDGETASDDDPSHYFGAIPAIDVEKATNGEDADLPIGPIVEVGSTVTWTYVVTNTGNVTLTNITLTDNQLGPISCPVNMLNPGDSTTCSATGTASVGQYANTATVTGTTPSGVLAPSVSVTDNDDSHYFGALPAIDVEKATNGEDADLPTGPIVEVGSTVVWTYVVTNTGNVTLTNITLTDNQLGAISCPVSLLNPGESTTCSTAGTASVGEYSNTATVTGTTPPDLLTPPVSVTDSDDSHYFGALPAIDVEKATNGEDADLPTGPVVEVGSTVVWTYVVINTGNVTLTNITLTDNQLGSIACPLTELGPGDSTTCSATGTAIAGQYANTATVTGTTPSDVLTPPVSVTDSDDSHYFGGDISIDVEKATNGEDADLPTGPFVEVGSTVVWTYIVTNTGNVTLTGITLTDNQLGAISCPVNALNPGESTTCSTTGTASAGQYANTATVTGTTPSGVLPFPATVTDSDDSHYFGALPSIDVEKSTNGEDADSPTGPFVEVGSTVTWTYVVTNTGNITLTDITLTDNQLGDISCPVNVLNPGESTTCSATGVASLGQYANTAVVTGTTPDGLLTPPINVTDSDDSHYFGVVVSIDLEKFTNGMDVDENGGPELCAGHDVVWSYLIENTGTITLTNLMLVDNNGTATDSSDDIVLSDATTSAYCPALSQPLAPSGTVSCTLNGTAIEGPYQNLAIVNGTTPSGLLTPSLTVTDSDPSNYLGVPAQSCALPSLGDFVWFDGFDSAGAVLNTGVRISNGIQDSDDTGVNGVGVLLFRAGDDPATATPLRQTETQTNSNGEPGYYRFDNLEPGDYFLQFDLMASTEASRYGFLIQDGQANDESLDSDVDTTGKTDIITLRMGDIDLRWDAGLVVSPSALEQQQEEPEIIKHIKLIFLPVVNG